jgi:heptosyltransferase-2
LRRVLVRLPNWLGDALMARPFLHSLRSGAAGASVVAVGPAPLLELLAPDAVWDEAFAWPLPAGAMTALRSPKPETAFVLPPSFSSAWFAFRTGAARRLGFAHEGRSPLLTDALRRPPRGDLHLAEEFLALGERAGLARGGAPGALAVAEGWRAEAVRLLGEAGPARPYAVLAPGAAYGPAKRWSAERFADAGRRLAARGWRVLLCGGAGERGTCDEVAARCGAESLAGRTSLTAMAALCAGADAVVSNDSGLAHLAGAVGAPTIAVFGSTSSAWTAPLGRGVVVAQRPPVCSPCFARTCAIGYRCLEAVSVDDVLSAVDRARAFAQSPAGGGGAA